MTKNKKKSDDIEDFGLTEQTQTHFGPSSKSVDHQVKSQGSLPLLIDIRGNTDMFDQVPTKAKTLMSAKVEVEAEGCKFFVRTGPVVIDQFLWTNQWVKFKMGLKRQFPVLLEPYQYANFRASVDLFAEFGAQKSSCAAKLFGKKVALGTFHMNETKPELFGCCQSPKIRFVSKSAAVAPTKVFINWPKGAASPQLFDQFDIPATLQSPIFRTRFGARGAYYLNVIPVMAVRKIKAAKPRAKSLRPQPSVPQKMLVTQKKPGTPKIQAAGKKAAGKSGAVQQKAIKKVVGSKK